MRRYEVRTWAQQHVPKRRIMFQSRKRLTFCWRHSLQARFTAVLRREDEGRVSPSPFSLSSSLEAERLKPRVLVGLVGDMAKGCWADIEIIARACARPISQRFVSWRTQKVGWEKAESANGGAKMLGSRNIRYSCARSPIANSLARLTRTAQPCVPSDRQACKLLQDAAELEERAQLTGP
jgi:hypothetical protein